jgi:hypothetical protein
MRDERQLAARDDASMVLVRDVAALGWRVDAEDDVHTELGLQASGRHHQRAHVIHATHRSGALVRRRGRVRPSFECVVRLTHEDGRASGLCTVTREIGLDVHRDLCRLTTTVGCTDDASHEEREHGAGAHGLIVTSRSNVGVAQSHAPPSNDAQRWILRYARDTYALINF